MSEHRQKRILLVDDNAAIHEDFKNLLNMNLSKKDSETISLEEDLFGSGWSQEATGGNEYEGYKIDDAYQGEEAVRMADTSSD